jgi:NitT/TauT family transport system substrate-binding protein
MYRRLAAIAFLACAVLSGSSFAADQALRVFTGSTAHWTDLIVAMRKGFFAQEGLEVEPTYFTTGAAATESFLAGKGDVVLTCELASLGMWKKGNVVGISRQAQLIDQEFLVVRGEITKPTDLEGKTLATRFGSTVEYFLRKYLQDEKVDASKVKIINLEPADMVVALDNGNIDGYTNYIPFPQVSLRATKSARIMATSSGHIDENCIYSASRDATTARKQDLVKFLKAIKRAQDYIPGHLDEAIKLAVDQFKGSESNTRLLLTHMKYGLGYDPAFRRDVQAVADFYKFGPVQWNQWFDPAPLKETAPDLVRLD